MNKRMIVLKMLIVALGLLLPSTSFAWEKAKNPDRFPSLGLSYTGTSESGDYKTQGFTQDIDSTHASLILDTRLPLSDSFTLGIGLGTTASNMKGQENAAFNSDELDTSGALFTISGRYYFNR